MSCLLLTLISDSSVMLFDEPLNGLDPGSIDILNSLYQTMVERGEDDFSSHAIANIQLICSKACFLKKWRNRHRILKYGRDFSYLS